MNLIEQLGGHEKAKKKLKMFYLLRTETMVDAVGNIFDRSQLEAALLQYRRQHNIFEVGDKVVSTLDGDEDWKNAVCEILAFHKKMAITTGFSCAIHHYDYRHATPEEIKAGQRL